MLRSFAGRRAPSGRIILALVSVLWGCQQGRAPADAVAPASGIAAPTPAASSPAASSQPPGAVVAKGAVLPPPAGGTSDGAAFSASELTLLDAVMAPSLVLSSAQRAVYRARLPETHAGQRSYAFELTPQPSMLESRHHHVLTFSFARAGTFLEQPLQQPEIVSGGGPGTSFSKATARTADGAYDVSVSEKMALPDTVPAPELHAEPALAAVLQRYDREVTRH